MSEELLRRGVAAYKSSNKRDARRMFEKAVKAIRLLSPDGQLQHANAQLLRAVRRLLIERLPSEGQEN